MAAQFSVFCSESWAPLFSGAQIPKCRDCFRNTLYVTVEEVTLGELSVHLLLTDHCGKSKGNGIDRAWPLHLISCVQWNSKEPLGFVWGLRNFGLWSWHLPLQTCEAWAKGPARQRIRVSSYKSLSSPKLWPLLCLQFTEPQVVHFFCFVLFCVLRKGFTYVAQAGFELLILLPQPPICWDYRHVPPCLVK
jgi:hypothetical protein